jgi:hypothetical protein
MVFTGGEEKRIFPPSNQRHIGRETFFIPSSHLLLLRAAPCPTDTIMRLTFQLLTNKKFTLDAVEPDTTVGVIKQRLVDEHQVSPMPGDLKLIHLGKIWPDTLALRDVTKFKESDMIVCMISKIKPKAATSATSATAASVDAAPAPVAAAAGQADDTMGVGVAVPAPVPAANQAVAAPLQLQADAVLNPPVPRAAAGQAMAAPSEESVTTLMDMGFERRLALAALGRAHNNVNMAADLLFEFGEGILHAPAPRQGIPLMPPGLAQALMMQAMANGAGGGGRNDDANPDEEEDEDDHPDEDQQQQQNAGDRNGFIQAVEGMVRNNPAALQAMLAAMGPQMAQLMNQPEAAQGMAALAANPGLMQAAIGGGGNGGMVLPPPIHPGAGGEDAAANDAQAPAIGHMIGRQDLLNMLGAVGAGRGRAVPAAAAVIELNEQERAQVTELSQMFGQSEAVCRDMFIACSRELFSRVGGTCAARSHRVRRFAPCADPFPPSTPQGMLSAARAALKPEMERDKIFARFDLPCACFALPCFAFCSWFTTIQIISNRFNPFFFLYDTRKTSAGNTFFSPLSEVSGLLKQPIASLEGRRGGRKCERERHTRRTN